MTLYFLDASAWVKLYYNEPGRDRVEAIMASTSPVLCSSLGVVEVHSSLARQRRSNRITSSAHARAITELGQHPALTLIEMSSDVIAIAKLTAARYGLRAADTVHLASAEYARKMLAGDDDDVVIVSSDDELNAAARMAGFAVINPADTV